MEPVGIRKDIILNLPGKERKKKKGNKPPRLYLIK
jgi:hypothetical protein